MYQVGDQKSVLCREVVLKCYIYFFCREEDVDPLFEHSLYDCSPCVELIGGLVRGAVGAGWDNLGGMAD